MKLIINSRKIVPGVILIVLQGYLMLGFAAVSRANGVVNGFAPIVYEQDGQKKHRIDPTNLAEVDLSSDIIVNFAMPEVESVQMTEQAEQIQYLLGILDSMGVEAARLNARDVDLSNDGEVQQLQKDAAGLFNRQNELFHGFKNLFRMASSEFTDSIIKWTAPDADTYLIMARMLNSKLEEVYNQAKLLENSVSVTVKVEAFHESPGNQPIAVHVKNYDMIPAGELRADDKQGFALTERDKQRLATEIKANELIVESINELRGNGKQILGNFNEAIDSLIDRIDTSIASINNAIDNTKSISGILKKLQAEPAIQSRAELVTQIGAALQVLGQLDAVKQDVTDLHSSINEFKSSSMSDKISIFQSALEKIPELINKCSNLVSLAGSLKFDLQQFTADIDAAVTGQLAEQWVSIKPILANLENSLTRDLPASLALLEFIDSYKKSVLLYFNDTA